jgi:hypothetical protein
VSGSRDRARRKGALLGAPLAAAALLSISLTAAFGFELVASQSGLRPSARRQHLLLGSGEAACDDMRAGCPEMAPDGCPPGSYSYLEEALTPDVPGTELDPCAGVQARASRD